MADIFCSPTENDDEIGEAYADTEIDRQLPRHELLGSVQATIYPLANQLAPPVQCAVLARDLSDRGFGISHTAPVRPGQRVELELPGGRLCGFVLWCRLIRDGLYIIGCRRQPGG